MKEFVFLHMVYQFIHRKWGIQSGLILDAIYSLFSPTDMNIPFLNRFSGCKTADKAADQKTLDEYGEGHDAVGYGDKKVTFRAKRKRESQGN